MIFLRREDWQVLALSLAGLFFIFIGLGALALPATNEGNILLSLNHAHVLNLMDGVGLLAIGLGVILTWLSGMVWQNIVRH